MSNMQLDQSSSVLASCLGAALVASVLTPHVAGDQLSFVEHLVTDAAGDNLTSVAIADMNLDGRVDILSNGLKGGLVWYENNGASPPVFIEQPPITTTVQFSFICVIDLDSDGDQDVVRSSPGSIRWYESSGGAKPVFTEHEILVGGLGGGPHCTFADINRDGNMDIVSGGATGAGMMEVAWYENDGNKPPQFIKHVAASRVDGHTPNAVFVEDMDRDGDPDILYCEQTFSGLTWLQNDGALEPEFERFDIITPSDGWHAIHAADVDCDGDPDIVAGAFSICWFESDGASPPMFTEHLVMSDDRPEEITCADLDNDGDVDVLAALLAQDEMSWYENIRGDRGEPPTFLKRVLFSQADSQPIHVLAGDLDCDGDLDLVMASRGDDSVRWFENVTCAADLDGDGVVGTPDILLLLGAWGVCP